MHLYNSYPLEQSFHVWLEHARAHLLRLLFEVLFLVLSPLDRTDYVDMPGLCGHALLVHPPSIAAQGGELRLGGLDAANLVLDPSTYMPRTHHLRPTCRR